MYAMAFLGPLMFGQVDGVKAVIKAPEKAALGDLIVLDSSGSQGLGFRWVLVGSDKTFLEVENGRKAVFATGTTGTYNFVLVAGSADKVGKPEVALAKHAVQVGPTGPAPGPTPPGPGPGPGPAPPGFGMEEKAYTWAVSLVMGSPNRAAEAKALATTFTSTAEKVGTSYSGAAAILRSLNTANNEALGSRPEVLKAWRPWSEAFAIELKSLYDARQLQTDAQWKALLVEVALGLSRVALAGEEDENADELPRSE